MFLPSYADVKSLTPDDSNLLDSQRAAFQKHNEEQFVIAKIPGSSGQEVCTFMFCQPPLVD